MAKTYTYNHKQVKISINGVALTDFNGDVLIEPTGDDWAEIQGQNNGVERSLLDNNVYTVTLPMMQTSPQVTALGELSMDDKREGKGPYPFVMSDLNGSDSIMGVCWIKNMKSRSKGIKTVARNVVLTVVSETEFEGA